MKTLPLVFSRKGFDFTQLRRKGDLALYGKARQGGLFNCFELVRVQQIPDRVMPGGRVVPAHEALPSSEQWGRIGWTFTDMNQAINRFDEMASA